ncbi:MAG: hypothetical protein O7E51_06055 [Acidobacteria bacterium]|nr:hypothetical protein [Acidobacteriota bacterium]
MNESPWARQQTVTRVVGGFGSGVFGEKEIFNRYFVRIVSAQPVRNAYLAIRENLRKQVLRESDETQDSQQRDVLALLPGDYLVLVVTFRSNDPTLEREFLSLLGAQTTGTLRTKAYLSTRRFPQLEIEAYFPPLEEAVGAKFVFPKRVDGQAIFEPDEESFIFEVDFPDDAPDLWVTFPVTEAVLPAAIDGQISPDRYLPEIAEFRILTERSGSLVDLESNRVAEVVNVFPMQQAGTIRGSIYEFHRNDALNARNFFDPVGEPLPEFKRNQFGIALNVSLGRRLNLFGSYEGTRINEGSTLVSLVPSAAMKGGDFSLLQEESGLTLWDPVSGEPFPNNQIPEERIHPVAGRLLSLFPDPNSLDPKRNFINSEPEVVNQDTTLIRADFNLRPGTDLRVQYEYQRQTGLDPNSLPAFVGAENGTDQEVSIALTHTFSPSFTGSWELEFRREDEVEGPQGERSAGLVESLGISGISVSDPDNEAYPAFSLDGYADIGDEGLPEGRVTNDLFFNADLTRTMGDHKLQFGGSLHFNQINNDRSPALERGEFDFSGALTEFPGTPRNPNAPLCPTPNDPQVLCPTGDAFADFLLGGVDKAERAVGESRQDLRSRSFELRLSEEWRINPQFLLTTGLTYHYFGPYHSIRQKFSVFHPLEFEPPEEGRLITVGTAEAKRAGLGDLIENGAVVPDKNNWAPRIGLAYRPFSNSRVVVRASYAVFYDPLQSWRYQQYLGRNFPFYFEEVSKAAGPGNALDLSSPFSTETPTELTVKDIQHDLPTSYFQEWQLSLGHQLTENWNLGIGYRGRRGLNEYRVLPANVPLPGPGDLQARRPNPTFGPLFIVSAGGSSKLHALVIEGERRLTDWYTMQFEFEWQREFDNEFDSNPSNPRNLRAEWAPSGRPELSFSFDYVINLPFKKGLATGAGAGLLEVLFGGWRVAGITQIRSGRLFSVGLRGDPNNDGVEGDRPDRLGPGQEEFTPTIDAWFDTSVFQEPGNLGFGNAGRNILVSPGSHQWDLSLLKEVFFENGHRLQLRFSFINAFNQVNFGQPNRTLDSRSFGEISSAGRAREMEIALRYMF